MADLPEPWQVQPLLILQTFYQPSVIPQLPSKYQVNHCQLLHRCGEGGAGAAWAVSLTPFPPQSGDLSLASAKHNLSEHRNAVTTITSGPSTFHPAHFIKASYLSKRDNLHFFTSSEVIQAPAPSLPQISRAAPEAELCLCGVFTRHLPDSRQKSCQQTISKFSQCPDQGLSSAQCLNRFLLVNTLVEEGRSRGLLHTL